MINLRHKILFLLIAVLLAGYGCTTVDGMLNALQQETGSLRVTSSEAGAIIFLNNIRQSEQTPATLQNVPVGSQTVRVQKSGFTVTPDSIPATIIADQEASVFFDLRPIVSGGSLRVISRPDSAVVLVNGIPLGDSILTPTTLVNLDSGSYRIEIQKSGFNPIVLTSVAVEPGSIRTIDTTLAMQRQLLVEHFSSSTCIPCVEADSIMEKILDERGVRQLVSIGYHTEIPSPGDPMYNEARQGNDARRNFYNVSANPISYFDGIVPVGGVINLESRLNAAIDQRLPIDPVALVEIFDYRVTATMVSARVRVQGLQDLSAYRLRVAVIETEINYASPPGVNGMTHFFDVFRGFAPDANGITINLTAQQTKLYNIAVPVEAVWDVSRIQLVAFLQQEGTSEVAQAASTRYPRY